MTVVREMLAGKSLGDALVASRQVAASEYQFQYVKARSDYLQQARARPALHTCLGWRPAPGLLLRLPLWLPYDIGFACSCAASNQTFHEIFFVTLRRAGRAQVEDATAFLKAAGITGAARAAVATLLGSVREAHKTPPALEFRSEAVISKVSDAWGMLVVQPPGAAAPPPH